MSLARLHFEFAPGVRPVNWIGRGLLATIIVVLGWQGLQLAGALQEQHRQSRALASLNAPKSGAASSLARSGKADPSEMARVRAAHLVERGLETPWADLLDSLEKASRPAVALISLEPSVAKQSVRLTAEARDPKEMLAYVSALQKDSRLSSVAFVSHQVQAQLPGAPVRFQLQAGWGQVP